MVIRLQLVLDYFFLLPVIPSPVHCSIPPHSLLLPSFLYNIVTPPLSLPLYARLKSSPTITWYSRLIFFWSHLDRLLVRRNVLAFVGSYDCNSSGSWRIPDEITFWVNWFIVLPPALVTLHRSLIKDEILNTYYGNMAG